MKKDTCDLCGLSLRHGAVVSKESDKPLCFCCLGCKQVYKMLLAASDDPSPKAFKETDIFKRCVAAGIIPGSMQDLEEKVLPAAQDGTEQEHQQTNIDAQARVPDKNTGLQLDLLVRGMWCPACAWAIDETLIKQPGVIEATCRFMTDRIKLVYNPVLTSPQRLMRVIEKLGYHGSPADDTHTQANVQKEYIRLGISAFLTMNVMMLSFALYTGFFTQLSADTIHNLTWPILVMSCAVYFYAGAPIHRRALSGLLSASPGMETLISIGASSAFFYSLFNWFNGSIHLYFDTACMLITLVLIGKTIEQRTKERINAQIGSFLEIQPSKLRLCTDAFPRGRYVDAKQLSHGDIFRVESEEIIAADGRILEGVARVDESTLSGEAKPIRKKSGDRVSSGTKIVSGSIKVSARAVGKDSLIGQLISIMEAALDRKSSMEGITDRVLKFFVPVIVLLAAITAVVCISIGLSVQDAIIRAVTILVISCPCALGIAIPLARVAGISLAGKNGILIHHFSAIDKIKDIDGMVFDKTGTLTLGKWKLTQTQILSNYSLDTVFSMAAGLESHASHYAGAAIVHAAREKKVVPATAEHVVEKENGICGRIDGSLVKIGSADFLSKDLAATTQTGPDDTTSPAAPVSTVYMSVDGTPCARFLFGDGLRESSVQVIGQLKKQGIKLALISGDSQETTQAIGDIVGISDCHGSMLPENKADFINMLRDQGYCVAMVGDGVNDVPALASADLGIAVHSAHQIGLQASGITLMGNDPLQILTFTGLASRVSRTIRQNLIFTFLYNIISIPIAMSGLLNPLVAVCAMLLSSLSVTGNTLLMIRGISADQK
jgi:P-type Cu+ transporter